MGGKHRRPRACRDELPHSPSWLGASRVDDTTPLRAVWPLSGRVSGAGVASYAAPGERTQRRLSVSAQRAEEQT